MTSMAENIRIMGIVNITDDSYFAESRCLGGDGNADIGKVLEKVGKMIEEGADIIDIGACSTRPGSEAVGAEEEWRRLEPALEAVRHSFPDIRISVDTCWSAVVEKTFDLIGDFIVNDISAGEDDSPMLETVGKAGLEYIAMHKRGTPSTMQSLCDYGNLTADILDYFKWFEEKACNAGIQNWILDPGFGFAKTVGQNYRLLRDLPVFCSLGRPVLVGVSRKSMIYRLFGITPEESLPQTQVLHFAALESGASILRVHDVAEAVRTREVFRLLCAAGKNETQLLRRKG